MIKDPFTFSISAVFYNRTGTGASNSYTVVQIPSYAYDGARIAQTNEPLNGAVDPG
jgi:hypothetical protein